MSLDQQLPPPPGQPGYPAAPPAQQRTSGLAIAGFILAFVIPLIGFILSLVAVFKTGAGRAKGRGLAVAGVIIGLVLTIGGVVTIVLVVNAVSHSTLADPGCTDGKDAIFAFGKGNSTPTPDSLKKIVADLNAAAAKAKHDDVRTAMKTAADDFSQLEKGMETGKMPDGIVEKLTADGNKIDSLCTLGGARN